MTREELLIRLKFKFVPVFECQYEGEKIRRYNEMLVRNPHNDTLKNFKAFLKKQYPKLTKKGTRALIKQWKERHHV